MAITFSRIVSPWKVMIRKNVVYPLIVVIREKWELIIWYYIFNIKYKSLKPKECKVALQLILCYIHRNHTHFNVPEWDIGIAFTLSILQNYTSNDGFYHSDIPMFQEEQKKHCQDLMHDVKRINKQFTAYWHYTFRRWKAFCCFCCNLANILLFFTIAYRL